MLKSPVTTYPTLEQRAATERELNNLRHALRAAHRDLVLAYERNGRPCDHEVYGPRYLPCPHPDCWTGPSRLAWPRFDKIPPGYWTPEPVLPTTASYETEYWHRDSVVVYGRPGDPNSSRERTYYWAWVK